MAITPAQLTENLNSLIAQWETDFYPLQRAVSDIRGEMSERIFGTGTDAGSNANGQKLPTKPYSTKPAYFEPNSLPSAPSQLQVGKRGKRIKSVYTQGGYAQIKNVLGRPPLELTNTLDIAFTDTPLVSGGQSVAIVVPDSESGKIAGLEKRYGEIFIMSGDEEQTFVEYLTEYITEALNKALE